MPYKGGKRDKAQLKYDKEVYTPEGAKSLSDKELRKEYSRIRSIARKRLERFEGTEWTDTQIYQENNGKLKPLKEIKSNRELRHLLSDAARFITHETGSVSGLENQRRNAVQALNDRGYDFVTKQNFREFADFMEYARVASLNHLYDSKRVAEFFEMAEKRKLKGEDLRSAFRTWRRSQAGQPKIQNWNPRTSEEYRHSVDVPDWTKGPVLNDKKRGKK
jgi:hypothetical protein